MGYSYYLEVWVQDTGVPGVGVSGGTVDVHYTTAAADAVAVANLDFDLVGSGVIDEPAGLIDDLGGGTIVTGAGVAPYSPLSTPAVSLEMDLKRSPVRVYSLRFRSPMRLSR